MYRSTGSYHGRGVMAILFYHNISGKNIINKRKTVGTKKIDYSMSFRFVSVPCFLGFYIKIENIFS